MKNAHAVTKDFEAALCEYTGAPYAVALDNCCSALLLCLEYERLRNVELSEVYVPKGTYPGVLMEIINAGGKIKFYNEPYRKYLTGAYQLAPYPIWDSALRFTSDMFLTGQMMCLSFTGPYKHLKLGKGGAILLDDEHAYKWLKKARYSGRAECSYHDDNFDDFPVVGHNFYMMPEIASRGLLLMGQFYNVDGSKKSNPDLSLPYPDLSKFKLFNR